MSILPGTFQVAVEAIIEKDGKILVTKRGPHRDHMPNEWEMITGRVNQGESFEEALHREVHEETRLKVEIIKPVDTFHFFRINTEMVGVSYLCKYVSGDVELEPTEQVEYRWLTPDEALQLIKIENIQKTILSYKNLTLASSQPVSSELLLRYQQIESFFAHTYPHLSQDVTLLARLSKITEEVGELTNEVHGLLGLHKASPHKHSSHNNLAQEWADVFNTVILMGLALKLDINKTLNERINNIFERYNLNHER